MEENDKPMNEFEWEEFMKKNDAAADKYSALLEQYMDDPNCDEIIAREMGWNHLLEEDGIERPWLDEMNEAMKHIGEPEEGDEWKAAAGIEEEDEESGIPDFDKDPLYQLGFSFTIDVMKWCDSLPENITNDADMIESMQNCAIPAAKIAGAVSFDDDDKDQLGFRLANYKRGLVAANKTLKGFSAALAKGLIEPDIVFPFIKRATELRNALAVRVLEIRDRFNGM